MTQPLPHPLPARFQVQLQLSPEHPAEFGHVTLTDLAVSFRSKPTGLPFAGLSVRRKLRAGLSAVDWDSMAGRAMVSFGEETWILTGPDVLALVRSLDPDGAMRRPKLLSGRATVSIDGGPASEGHLELDAERLRFRPDGKSRDLLDAAWSSIGPVRLTGYRPALTTQVAGQAVRIEGELAPGLSAWLTALSEGVRAGIGNTSERPHLERWTAQRRHGALAIQGELVVSAGHVQFVPLGLVERAIGLKDVVVPFRGLHRVVVHGWSQKKLTLVTEKSRETFTFEDVDARFEGLVLALHEGLQLGAQEARREHALVDDIMQRWSTVFEQPTARVVEAQRVVQVRGKRDATVGILLQTADEVRFLPSGGPAGTAKAESHAVPRILRNYSGAGSRADELSFTVSGEHFRYLPSEGAEFVRRFWDRCRAPSRIFHLDAPSRRALSRVLGPSRFVRIRALDGRSISVSQLHEEGRTWMAAVEDGGHLPEVGDPISVDVGQPEGVYRFESQVVDVDAVASEFLFARPSTVRVYNQRRSVRVSVDLSAKVRVGLEQAGKIPVIIEDSLFSTDPLEVPSGSLQLSDLSLGGCAAEGDAELPLGASVELEVDLHEPQPLRVTGRVLRADRVDGSVLHRFGIRFENIHHSEEARLQRHVLRAQREQLAQLDAMVG